MLNPMNGWRINPSPTLQWLHLGPRAAGRVWSPDPMSREAERRRYAMCMARVPTDRHWCAAMLA
jgi:hypothetical protein